MKHRHQIIMSRAERDAADLVETMLRLDDHSPASSLQLSPYHRGKRLSNNTRMNTIDCFHNSPFLLQIGVY